MYHTPWSGFMQAHAKISNPCLSGDNVACFYCKCQAPSHWSVRGQGHSTHHQGNHVTALCISRSCCMCIWQAAARQLLASHQCLPQAAAGQSAWHWSNHEVWLKVCSNRFGVPSSAARMSVQVDFGKCCCWCFCTRRGPSTPRIRMLPYFANLGTAGTAWLSLCSCVCACNIHWQYRS